MRMVKYAKMNAKVISMGLFDKLLGGNASANDALNTLKKAAKDVGGKLNSENAEDAFGSILKAAKDVGAKLGAEQNAPARQNAAPAAAPAQAPAPAEDYDDVPAGDNQYNFKGSYREYFANIFREEFPSYEVRQSDANGGKVTLFAFYRDGRQVLLVELMSDRSEANKRRCDTQAAGIAYLRFYYDHPGWWNERSYVVSRVGKVLG